jgi:hypothetical protein
MTRRSIALVTLGSLLAAGCSGGSENKAIPFKKQDTAQFDQMKSMMMKNAKSHNYAGSATKK